MIKKKMWLAAIAVLALNTNLIAFADDDPTAPEFPDVNTNRTGEVGLTVIDPYLHLPGTTYTDPFHIYPNNTLTTPDNAVNDDNMFGFISLFHVPDFHFGTVQADSDSDKTTYAQYEPVYDSLANIGDQNHLLSYIPPFIEVFDGRDEATTPWQLKVIMTKNWRLDEDSQIQINPWFTIQRWENNEAVETASQYNNYLTNFINNPLNHRVFGVDTGEFNLWYNNLGSALKGTENPHISTTNELVFFNNTGATNQDARGKYLIYPFSSGSNGNEPTSGWTRRDSLATPEVGKVVGDTTNVQNNVLASSVAEPPRLSGGAWIWWNKGIAFVPGHYTAELTWTVSISI
ncbi:MAG: WxL domain-containing protein [Lactobacillales bacterium]|nr:WxL domain-containing protein [Lactobacillales bacterium]